MSRINAKSDIGAKQAFIEELIRRGFDRAFVTGSPADITAYRGEEKFYFEIKYTSKETQYFGAATLTEWEAALSNEGHYWFVVAMKRDGLWRFHEYTPDEFMKFSSIPPFKIFFNIAVGSEKATEARGGSKRVRLTKERIAHLVEIFRSLRSPKV